MKRILWLSLLFLGLQTQTGAQAAELRTVLMSSAYGAGAGALVGVTALAFSDNPSQNLNMVARGASLGLYAGLAVGIYLASQEKANQSPWAMTVIPNGDQLAPGLSYTSRF